MKLPFDREEPIVVSRTYRPSTRILSLSLRGSTVLSRADSLFPRKTVFPIFPYTWLNIVVPYRMENRFLSYVPNILHPRHFLVTSGLSSFKRGIAIFKSMEGLFMQNISVFVAKKMSTEIFERTNVLSRATCTDGNIEFYDWSWILCHIDLACLFLERLKY